MRPYKKLPVYVMNYIDHTIKVEGGYVDHISDSGGKTKYGITESLARAYGYSGDMKDLQLSLAEDIYASEFYFKPHLNLIDGDEGIQGEVFDSSVNVGSGRAIRWLQTSLNAFNKRGALYKDLVVDGVLGEATSEALSAYLAHRGSMGRVILLKALNSLQGAFYIELSQRREKDEDFVYGWLSERVSL